MDYSQHKRFDEDFFNMRTDNDSELVEKVLSSTIKTLEKFLNEIDNNTADIDSIAHHLKGTAMVVGLYRLGYICSDIMKNDDEETVSELVDFAKNEMILLVDFLGEKLKSLS